MSLVSVVMALGVTGLLALVTAKLVTNMGEGVRSASDRSELEVLRRTVMNRLSCAETMARPGFVCDGRLVDAYDRQGRLFLSSSGAGTKLGRFTIRARCDPATGLIHVQAARLKPGRRLGDEAAAAFYSDALNYNKLQSWGELAPWFFPVGTTPCDLDTLPRSVVTASPASRANPIARGAYRPLRYDVEVADELSEFDGVHFTARERGLYLVSLSTGYVLADGSVPASWHDGGSCVELLKASAGAASVVDRSCNYPGSSGTPHNTTHLTSVAELKPGDRLYARGNQTINQAPGVAGSTTLYTDPTTSRIVIQRLR